MNTYLVRSATNYGEVVHVVVAVDEDDVRDIVSGRERVWEGYEIEEINTNNRGVVVVIGGDGG